MNYLGRGGIGNLKTHEKEGRFKGKEKELEPYIYRDFRDGQWKKKKTVDSGQDGGGRRALFTRGRRAKKYGGKFPVGQVPMHGFSETAGGEKGRPYQSKSCEARKTGKVV